MFVLISPKYLLSVAKGTILPVALWNDPDSAIGREPVNAAALILPSLPKKLIVGELTALTLIYFDLFTYSPVVVILSDVAAIAFTWLPIALSI